MKKYNDSRQRKNPIGRLAAFLVAMAVLTGCGAEKPDGAAQEEETELKAEPAAEVQSGGFAGESARDAQIDFAALQAENPDIFAWLYIPDTAIDRKSVV